MRPAGARRVGHMKTVADVIEWVEAAFPARLAQEWDAVGLVCGRPDAPVNSIMLTVDVTEDVVAQALADGVDFILAHHPLMLNGVTSVAPSDAKGRIIHDLIENQVALFVAHTNADSARPGVSDALAELLGLVDTQPLEPVGDTPLDKVTVYVPGAAAQPVLNALSEAGAGRIGNYERCGYFVEGTGTFLPLHGADPHIGRVGVVEEVAELRLEMVLPRTKRAAVVTALHDAHPYEEPAFDLTEIVNADTLTAASLGTGLGRVGRLPQAMALSELCAVVADVLPATSHGVRVAGDLTRMVSRVAVCGGSGDSLLAAANQANADVYLTADLKHHRVVDHLAEKGCAIIDVAHYASEFPWCPQTAVALSAWLVEQGDNVAVTVSEIVTDPWTEHVDPRRS